MNTFEKIISSIVEARLLKRFFRAIGRLIRKPLCFIRGFFDWMLSIIPRLLLCYTSKVQKNKIVFMTFNHQYSCNPKYICEEILRQELPVEIVWTVTNAQLRDPAIRDSFPPNAKLVVRGTYPFFKEIVTSKIWIDNAFNFTWNPIPKKRNQFYIQTWHGSLGLKRIDKRSVKNKRWSFAGWLNARYVNACISNSTFETGVFRETHWPKNDILELGHARNDILFSDEATQTAIKEKVLAHFGIPAGTKIALYGPTYRESDTTGVFDLHHSDILDALQSRFGGDWVLLNRYHFKTKFAKNSAMGADKRILNASSYPDIQELMVASDIGITDYSSWIYDFMLTGRPGFLYVPDLAEYNQDRGFYYPLSETPFPYAETNEDMVSKILAFDLRTYKTKHAQFLEARGCKEQGTAAKEIVEIIKQQCELN